MHKKSKYTAFTALLAVLPIARAADLNSENSFYFGAIIVSLAAIAFVVWSVLYLKKYSGEGTKAGGLSKTFSSSVNNYIYSRMRTLSLHYNTAYPPHVLNELKMLIKLLVSKDYNIPFKNQTKTEIVNELKKMGVDDKVTKSIDNFLGLLEQLKYADGQLNKERARTIFYKANQLLRLIHIQSELYKEQQELIEVPKD